MLNYWTDIFQWPLILAVFILALDFYFLIRGRISSLAGLLLLTLSSYLFYYSFQMNRVSPDSTIEQQTVEDQNHNHNEDDQVTAIKDSLDQTTASISNSNPSEPIQKRETLS